MAAVSALTAIPARSEIVRPTFIRQSVMDSGIRSATRGVLPASAQDAALEVLQVRVSPPVTQAGPMAVGTLLASQTAPRREVGLAQATVRSLVTRLSPDREHRSRALADRVLADRDSTPRASIPFTVSTDSTGLAIERFPAA